MKIIYSEHAILRMKQRGITEIMIGHVLGYPFLIKKSFEGRKEAIGEFNGKIIKVVFVEVYNEIENDIKVVTVI